MDIGYEGAWNFGPTKERSDQPVRWVVDRFIEEWGAGSWTTPASAEGQPHEAQRLSLDSTKARNRLGWAPVWDPPRRFDGPHPGTASTTGPLPALAPSSNMSWRPTRTTPARRG